MTQFQEGQDVEVTRPPYNDHESTHWRKAKIRHPGGDKYVGEWWYVQFPDGTRGVFGVGHIRALEPADEYPGLAEPDDDTSEPMGSAT